MTAGLDFNPGKATPPAVFELRRELDAASQEMRDAIAGERRAHDALAARLSTLDEHVSARLDAVEKSMSRVAERLDDVMKALNAEGRVTARGATVGGVGGSAAAAALIALARWLGGF